MSIFFHLGENTFDSSAMNHLAKHQFRNLQVLDLGNNNLLNDCIDYFLKGTFKRIVRIDLGNMEKEKLNKIPVADDVIETEIAATPNNATIKKNTGIGTNRNQAQVKEVAFTPPLEERKISVDKNTEAVLIDTRIKETQGAEIVHTEEQFIDDEIEQLLYKSKIKLIVDGQISSKKLVNANALLNSVEEDLDKDLKQILLEKIVNTIKKDKEVVSSKEN